MSFGFKTSWIAVRDRTTVEVADALQLADRLRSSFADGTEAAYRGGVYVTAPISGWTLAHGVNLEGRVDPETPAFVAWLRTLSTTLGEVQYFGTHRGSGWQQWGWAQDGEIIRVYALADGDLPLFIGEPTPAEIELGVGTRGLEPDSETWGEQEWEQWWTTVPTEEDVMKVAARWSVDPSGIRDEDVTEAGIFGRPPSA